MDTLKRIIGGKTFILVLIILLAAVLRLVSLDKYPVGLNADEAALGYNAYSLGQTGRDEHGHFLPVNLESFGDFKPALYSYLLVPVVKIFGLTELAVRIPSAMFGILSVVLIYHLALQVTGKKSIAVFSALSLAVSPWHLHYSRGAWEVNVATTLILLGVVSFLRWTTKQKFIHLFLTITAFALSMYTYQSTRVIAPVLGVGLALIFLKPLLSSIKQSLFAFVLLVLLLIPLAFSVITSDAASRVGGVGLTADEGPLNFVKELRGQHSDQTSIVGRLFHNRPVIYSLQLVKNYLSHFDGNFLFVNGDLIERNRVPETGLFHLTDLVFILLGFAYLLTSNKSSQTKGNNLNLNVVWLWLLVAPLASAMTFQVPHALRAHNLIIPLTVVLAAGFVYLKKLIKKRWFLMLVGLMIAASYLWQFSRYLHQYYVHYPKTYPAAWQYGFKELVSYVDDNQDRYTNILVTNRYDQPYILFLFYLRYPPEQFQLDHQLTFRDRYNFSTVEKFSKYQFQNTSWDLVRDRHDSLIIAAPGDIPEVGVNLVKTINFPNGQPAFKIISN